jgi:hypothetical protein
VKTGSLAARLWRVETPTCEQQLRFAGQRFEMAAIDLGNVLTGHHGGAVGITHRRRFFASRERPIVSARQPAIGR